MIVEKRGHNKWICKRTSRDRTLLLQRFQFFLQACILFHELHQRFILLCQLYLSHQSCVLFLEFLYRLHSQGQMSPLLVFDMYQHLFPCQSYITSSISKGAVLNSGGTVTVDVFRDVLPKRLGPTVIRTRGWIHGTLLEVLTLQVGGCVLVSLAVYA